MTENVEDIVQNIKPIDLRVELFRKKDFSFIVEGLDEDGELKRHEKQEKALQILTANKYKEFLFGGAAGGSKTWTGCSWLLFMGLCYPGTRYFVARNELKDILDSVKVTFDKVCKEYGFKDYKFNGQKNYIQFANGSHINFIELKYKPSDPLYEDVGSTEYTCGWVEEAGEINKMGVDIIGTRVGRHMNKKYNIKGLMFYTSNPKANWTKTEFYIKHKAGNLEDNKFYLPCFVTDNPFVEKDYVEGLRELSKKDKSSYQRLFLGNWDYEDNKDQVTDQEMIEQIYENDHVPQGKTYITADVARLGSDKAVIGVWRGWRLFEIITYDISKTTKIQDTIYLLRKKYHIPKNRCIVDSDGVGGGVVDNTGVLGFNNNGTPLKEKGVFKNKYEKPRYRNLQVQCLYHLAYKINEGGIWIMADINEKQKQEIKEELAQIIREDSDYGKMDLKRKSEIKQSLGRSPDYRDMLMMRMWFDLRGTRNHLIKRISQ